MSDMTNSAAGIVAEAAPTVKKTCSKCGVEKVLEEFHLDKDGKFGRRRLCKVCACARARDYRQRPGVKERQRAYDQRPEVKARQRAYSHRPEVKERQRAYQQRPEYKEWQQAYLERPGVKERQRAYMRDYQRNYVRDRLRTDPAFKLADNLRTRLRLALKGTCKSARTLELLGCTVEELRAHLEAQFKPGMTWENQGYRGWHIDHIRPCASFDLTDPEQQRLCFHYTNLQPLWAKENMSKGAKFSLTPLRRPE